MKRRKPMLKTDYELLIKQAKAITEDVPHLTANLANLSALIWQTLDDINWAGFYLREGDKLILGPFQGNVACVEIAFGKGVCGTAAQQDATLLVPDVHRFKGHIACDSASRSEIVVPLHRDGKVVGVLDIDSPTLSRFTQEDQEGLERLCLLIERLF
ncbi:MAG: GAF domain-containing protein [Ruminococcus sp.]|nr:GAF domain-containing protein [Ruminococcus sp.]